MKVVLVVPPGIENLEIYKIAGVRAPPLGLAWIAAVLEQEGYDVSIIDSPTLQLSEQDFIYMLRKEKPDVVGITSITPTIYKAYRAAEIIKEIYPEIPIVVGGPHVTFMYDEALSKKYIDFVVLGEGEYTMLELVKTLERHGVNYEILKSVKGIAFKMPSGETVITPPRPPIHDLNKLPKPARHLLPMDKYTFLNKPVRILHVMASRGCPYGCVYCSTSYFWGRRVRFRDPELVVDEIEEGVYKYKVSHIAFTDDEFTIIKPWVLKFVEEVKRRKLDISFSCGSRVDHVDDEILKSLKSVGCSALYFGVESANQESLDRIGKRITVSQVIKAFEKSKNAGIEAVGSFILGFPWETIDDMKRTIKFSMKLKPSYAQFTVLTPYPGTPIFKIALKDKLIEDWNWENYTTLRAVMRGYHFTRKQLQKMLTYAYRKFYARLGFLWEQIKKKRLLIILGVIKNNILPWLLSPLKRH